MPEIEKVARAIMGRRIAEGLAFDDEIEAEPEISNTPTHADYYMARAALEAIREPSEGMMRGASARGAAADDPVAVYTAMIDHILGEEPKP